MTAWAIFWRDLKIVIQSVWINLAAFVGLLTGAAVLLHASGAYPQASWLELLVDAFHMAVIERVIEGGEGTLPLVLTLLMPLLSLIILGEGALRVLSTFVARSEHREDWDRMVAKSFEEHVVVCGVGELGRALVKNLLQREPKAFVVLVDPKAGILAELDLRNPNLIHLAADMTNPETLKAANCQKARLIVLSSGSDALNTEAAYKVLQTNPAAEIWVRLYHSGLAELLDLSRKPNIHFFCPYQQAAEAIVNHIMGGTPT